MLYIVLTTGRCNLRCDYCGGSFDPSLVPARPTYDMDLLVELVEGDPDPVVAFYGGEPLLNRPFVEGVARRLRGRAKLVLQTNGLLVRAVSRDVLTSFDAILMSVDGVAEVTDAHRGRGVYARVIDSAKYLRSIGYRGDLVARMTVTRDTDIARDVRHLLGLGLFDHVHWQLDVVWSSRWDLETWAARSYLPGVESLADEWFSALKSGSILGVAPFQGIIKRHYLGGPSPPCGAGSEAIAVSTDGRILACPIAVSERWAEMGSLGSGIRPREYPIREECSSCEYYRECGGRCLYSFMERLWGADGHEAVCRVTKSTIDAVIRRLPILERAVASGAVRLEDIFYPKFNNTVEIIP
ncbi:MAG: TIGR04084 family radical SAM/SPASM domain-containing protein [Conexivisphaera sp.]